MKFCPQCGTFFEPGARFCLECGFERSTVESISPAPPLTPEVLIPDAETNITEPAEAAKSQPEIKHACPQCGSALMTGDRFCLKCGFDTSGKNDVVEDVPQEISSPIIEEETNEVSAVAEMVSKQGIKQFCPECGSVIDADERFCHECGFDTKSDKIVSDIKPEPAIISPVAEKQSIAKPAISQPAPDPVRPATPNYDQTPKQAKPATQQKEKKIWRRIAFIIIAVVVLGAIGWFGYNKYFVDIKDTPANKVANTKPMSLMDQELANQKSKNQNQAIKQEPSKEDLIESAIAKERNIKSEVILEVGRSEEPKNKNPKNPVKLNISRPTMITRITTDHYNDGMGTPRGGIITIKDRSGMVVAGYKALGKTGKNGTPSAKWVVEPNKIFNKGTYFIWDSDPLTWSKTFIGNNGFVVVEGYEVK